MLKIIKNMKERLFMGKKKEIKGCSTCKYAIANERRSTEDESFYTTYKCTLQNNRLIYDSRENEKECELELHESK